MFLEVYGSFPDVKASLRLVLGSRRGHRELRIAQLQQGRLSSFGSRLGIVAEETPRLGRGAASAGHPLGVTVVASFLEWRDDVLTRCGRWA